MNSRMKKSFEAVGVRWSRTKERGATAVVIALCLTLLMAAAAMSFDTANLALKRQTLQNLTDAAAQAGAVHLRDFPTDLAGAQQAAFDFAHAADATFTLADVTLWCIVPSTGATKQIAPGNIGPVCNPIILTGKVCDENLCAIPCTASGASCNAIRVKHEGNVLFYFAPAIGIPSGSTGAVTSVSCAKSCGSGGKPNPMDVAIIADRTPSMDDGEVTQMKAGIKSSLEIMTPEYQFATLGTIHKSNAPTANDCKTLLPIKTAPGTEGTWTPLGFSNNYLTGDLTSPAGSRKLKPVTAHKTTLGEQVGCMNNQDPGNAPWYTHLAAPLKAAARVLLGKSGTTSGITAQMTSDRNLLTDNAPVTKWIFFETDGQPMETMKASDSTSLDTATDPSAPGDDAKGCKNLETVATNAKKAGNDIKIVMIAYGDATTAYCGSGRVKDTMARAASPANGNPSLADKSCTSKNGQPAAENTDGDYFYCAATGADLQSVFKTAIGSASSSTTKFVRMPK